MKKEFTPNDVGDVTDWFVLHGDFSLSVYSTTPSSPAGAGTVIIERKDKGGADASIEKLAGITAADGTADTVTGSERMRGVQHRLRCTALTAQGAVYVLRGSGLIDA